MFPSTGFDSRSRLVLASWKVKHPYSSEKCQMATWEPGGEGRQPGELSQRSPALSLSLQLDGLQGAAGQAGHGQPFSQGILTASQPASPWDPLEEAHRALGGYSLSWGRHCTVSEYF